MVVHELVEAKVTNIFEHFPEVGDVQKVLTHQLVE